MCLEILFLGSQLGLAKERHLSEGRSDYHRPLLQLGGPIHVAPSQLLVLWLPALANPQGTTLVLVVFPNPAHALRNVPSLDDLHISKFAGAVCFLLEPGLIYQEKEEKTVSVI